MAGVQPSQPASSRRHRRLIRILLVIVVFFGSIAVYNRATAPPKYQPKYQTIAHRFLDLESKYDPNPDSSYELLDDVITDVKSRTHYDPTITNPAAQKKQLLQIFNTIDSVLIERNFIFPPDYWTSTLGEALIDSNLSSSEMEAALAKPHNARRAAHMKEHADEPFHLMACEPSAFLYMGVAESLGFELKPVNFPKHIFVRAYLDKDDWINWDPNRGRSISDADYAHDWGVEDWQIREKIFLQPLSADEIEADMYTNIGVYRANRRAVISGFAPADECYHKAIALNPNDLYANSNLALNLLFDSDPSADAQAEALKLAQHAIELHPNEAAFHETLAFVWATRGQTAAAVTEMNKAIQLEPENQDLRDMLPLIESGHTMYSAFKAQNPIKFWLGYEHGCFYVLGFVITSIVILVIRWIRRRIARRLSPPPPTILLGPPVERAAA